MEYGIYAARRPRDSTQSCGDDARNVVASSPPTPLPKKKKTSRLGFPSPAGFLPVLRLGEAHAQRAGLGRVAVDEVALQRVLRLRRAPRVVELGEAQRPAHVLLGHQPRGPEPSNGRNTCAISRRVASAGTPSSQASRTRPGGAGEGRAPRGRASGAGSGARQAAAASVARPSAARLSAARFTHARGARRARAGEAARP